MYIFEKESKFLTKKVKLFLVNNKDLFKLTWNIKYNE